MAITEQTKADFTIRLSETKGEPKTTDGNPWLQIDLGGLYATVTAVATQGRHNKDEWVTEYMLQYSNETLNFQNYREPGQTEA